MPFHDSRFFQETIGCHVLAAESLFYGQKGTGNNWFEKILLTGFKFERASTHALDQADRTTGRGVSKN